MQIVKQFHFDSAHMLSGHDGKCSNLHGHSYQLEVAIGGQPIKGGAKDGMLIDFADLKHCVQKVIVEPLDHAFLYHQHSDEEVQLAQLLQSWQKKTFAFSQRTTVENLAKWIFAGLQQQQFAVSFVRLWETPSSYCEYR